MTYPAQTLITRSWYLSRIVARNLQTPTADQINDGLMLLNALLDWKAVQLDLIPYWTYKTDVTTVVGQETYFLSNVVAIESVTFNIDVVRYPTDYVTRRTYFASARVDNIDSLPFSWTYNRSLGGGTLYLYFKPDGNYPLKIMCKIGLTDVTLQTDLSLSYDGSYIEYLRHALAQYMCAEYGVSFNEEAAKNYKDIKRQLIDVSPPDLSMIKSSILTEGGGINYGDINIGRGYRPS